MWPLIWMIVALIGSAPQAVHSQGAIQLDGILDQVSQNAANLVANSLINDANQQVGSSLYLWQIS